MWNCNDSLGEILKYQHTIHYSDWGHVLYCSSPPNALCVLFLSTLLYFVWCFYIIKMESSRVDSLTLNVIRMWGMFDFGFFFLPPEWGGAAVALVLWCTDWVCVGQVWLLSSLMGVDHVRKVCSVGLVCAARLDSLYGFATVLLTF